MAVTLHQSDPDFEKRFSAFLATKREVSADVDAVVREIIAGVEGVDVGGVHVCTRVLASDGVGRLLLAESRIESDSA